MKSFKEFTKIYLHRQPIDFRKGISGLSVIVATDMVLDLKQKSLFVFTNRKRSHMKILYFDKSGFALWLKRLDESKFSWPKNLETDTVEVSLDDMQLLLDGVNIWTRFKRVDFEYVV